MLLQFQPLPPVPKTQKSYYPEDDGENGRYDGYAGNRRGYALPEGLFCRKGIAGCDLSACLGNVLRLNASFLLFGDLRCTTVDDPCKALKVLPYVLLSNFVGVEPFRCLGFCGFRICTCGFRVLFCGSCFRNFRE